ncbi:hypothetical protein CV770_18475 [Bradyrhizobium sp. AC87j1]|nr:hypothetical protein CV770_18475 [Bradyrhizobium sp. AC87j1]
MSQTEYAAHRGVSRQAISKLVKAGKIPESAIVDGKIDPAAADFALGETRERILVADAEEGDDFGGADPTFGSAAGTRAAASGDSNVARLTRAKTATEIYRARTAELEYDQRVGKLLSTEDVTRSMEKCAAVIVRELEGLPNFADEIAAAIAKDGLPGARQALKNIARNVRLALEQNMRVVAAEDDETTGKEGVTS